MDQVGPVVKRSLVIAGRKTSVSLEDDFWEGLKLIAASRQIPVWKLTREIQATRGPANLSSAIRVYVLRYFRQLGRGAEGLPTEDLT